MTLLAEQSIDRAGNGLTESLIAAVSGGNWFTNTGKQFVIITNASGSVARTVTFATPLTVDGLAVDNLAVVVALSSTHIVGPFKTTVYNDSDSLVQMTYSSEADLTLGVFSLSAALG